MRAWILLINLGATACLPDPHSAVGRHCDREHVCGEGLVCVAGLCEEEGPPLPNVLLNGGFEDGLNGWFSSAEVSTDRVAQPELVRSGALAAKLSLKGGAAAGSTVSLSTVQQSDLGLSAGDLYCAEAWIRVGEIGASVKLLLKCFTASGSIDSDSDDPLNSAHPVPETWVRLQAKLQIPASCDRAINLRVFDFNAPAGGLFFDDARLWRSDDGSCASP